ncbi:hypothetical protein DMC47_25540 [Nostoc sp. 3335mG]|nr:hypothetical protein DMC47_25540 [Nostoc sp. 3335mG]
MMGSWSTYARGRRPFDRRAAHCYRLLAIQGMAIVILIWALGFGYRGQDIDPVLAVLAAVVATALLLRWRGLGRLAAGLEAAALVLAASMAVACLSVLVAALGAPYQDDLLAGADRLIFPFLSWPALARAAGADARLMAAMCWVYSTLLWQPFLLVTLLAALGRFDRLWHFVRAWMLALVLSVAIFALIPAVTAYVHYGLSPADSPFLTVNAGWRPAQIIADLRSGAIRELGVGQMAGLITFPSFHAAGAVLLGWGFRRIPLIGIPFLLLNAAMLPTIPVVGSHYFVDVLGGVAVALLAIVGSDRRGGRTLRYLIRLVSGLRQAQPERGD